jgi:hypothetical protein
MSEVPKLVLTIVSLALVFSLITIISLGTYVEGANETCRLSGHHSAKLVNWETVCADRISNRTGSSNYYYSPFPEVQGA